MKTSPLLSLRRLQLIAVLGVLFLLPSFASADIEQPIYGTSAFATSFSYMYQKLGNGLSGTATGVGMYVKTLGVVGISTGFGIDCFTDAGYTSSCGGTQGTTTINTLSNITFNSASFTPIVFDPDNYYRLRVGFAVSSCTVIANYCFVYGTSTESWSGGDYAFGDGSVSGGMDDFAFTIYGSTLESGATRIITMTPVGTIATSSTYTLNITGYLSDDDWTGNEYLHIILAPNQSFATPNQSIYDWTIIDIPIPSAGAFSVSTTTTLIPHGNRSEANLGRWVYQLDFNSPLFAVFGYTFFSDSLVSTTTSFTLVASNFLDSVGDQVDEAVALLSSTTLSYDLSGCDVWSTFDLDTCLIALTVPPASSMYRAISILRDEIGTRWPWGYLTRFGVILSGSATTTLPSLVITLPSGYIGAGQSFDLTPWDSMLGATSMISTAVSAGDDPRTLRDIVEPYWVMFVSLSFGLMVFGRMLGISFAQNGSEYEDYDIIVRKGKHGFETHGKMKL